MQGQYKKQQKDQLVFSSEDSMHSEISIISSDDEVKTTDNKSEFIHLTQQMKQFFNQNQQLQDGIKFDRFEISDDDEHPKQNQAKKSNQKEEETIKTEKASKLWNSIILDVQKNSHKIPKIETINHRLNIFKQKNEKVDFFEWLRPKYSTLTTAPADPSSQSASNNQTNNQNSSEKNAQNIQGNTNQNIQNNNMQNNYNIQNNENIQNLNNSQQKMDQDDESLIYFSFKKKFQQQFQKKHKKQKVQQLIRQRSYNPQQRRENTIWRGNSEATRLAKSIEAINQIKYDNKLNNSVKGKNQLGQSFSQQKQQKYFQYEKLREVNTNFETRIGQILYQTYQQQGDDIEQFKKTASFILKDYVKNKQNKKTFPPSINPFKTEESKILNNLIPNFNSILQVPNKNNIFTGVDQNTLKFESSESNFIQFQEKLISNSGILQFWEELQLNQK